MSVTIQNTHSLARKAVQCITDVGSVLATTACAGSDQADGSLTNIAFRELELELKISITKLAQWRVLWFPDSAKPDDVSSTLWGQAGRDHIRTLLEEIVHDSDVLLQDIEAASDQTTPKRGHRKWSARIPLNWGRIQKRWRTDLPNRGFPASYTLRQKYLGSLAEGVDKVWTESELCFRRLHATTYIADPVEDSLDKILETQQISHHIYDFLRCTGVMLYLNLDLLNNDSEMDKFPDLFDWQDLRVTYHFWLTMNATPDFPSQIILESIPEQESRLDEAPSSEVGEGDLLNFIRSLPGSLVKVNLSKDSMSKRPFFVKIVPNEAEAVIGSEEVTPLVIDHERDSVCSKLSRHERICLAFQVVQSGLFLLGTPWLSHLNSRSIFQIKTKYSAIFCCKISHPSQNALDMPAHGSLTSIEQEQTTQIGVLLLEIALGKTIESGHLPGNQFYNDRLQQAEAAMGKTYAQACQFCLNNSDSQYIFASNSTLSSAPGLTDIETKRALRAYYVEVYLR